VSCDPEEDDPTPVEETGFLSLDLGFDIQNAGGRSQQVNTDSWEVIIYDSANTQVERFEDFAAMPSEVPLPVGTYTVFVSSEINEVGFESPYYEGTSAPFQIVKGDVVSVTVEAELANVKVSVFYSDAVQADFTNWSTSVSSASGVLDFVKGETRSGNYPAGEALTLQANLTFTKSDNSTEVRTVTGTIAATAPRDHFVITVDYDLEDGVVGIGIVVNDSTNDIPIDLSPQVIGFRGYGGAGFDQGYTGVQRPNGNYILAGTAQSTDGDVPSNAGHYDMFLMELDASGNVVWVETRGTNNVGIERVYSVENTPDGGFVVAGGYNRQFGILKYGAGRNLQWLRDYGFNDEFAYDVEPLADGTYVVTGRAGSVTGDVSENLGNYDCWTIRLGATGNLMWDKSIGGVSTDFGSDIDETTDGNYIIGGSMRIFLPGTNSTQHEMMISKMSPTGQVLWTKTYGGTLTDYAWGITEVSDGYLLAGEARSTNGDVSQSFGNSDGWLVKVDLNGDLVWEKSYGGSGNDGFRSIELTDDGKVILGGFLTVDGDSQFWALKVDGNGNEIWSKTYGSSGYDQMWEIKTTQDGGFIGMGYVGTTDEDVNGGPGNTDMWMIKLDSQGNLENQ